MSAQASSMPNGLSSSMRRFLLPSGSVCSPIPSTCLSCSLNSRRQPASSSWNSSSSAHAIPKKWSERDHRQTLQPGGRRVGPTGRGRTLVHHALHGSCPASSVPARKKRSRAPRCSCRSHKLQRLASIASTIRGVPCSDRPGRGQRARHSCAKRIRTSPPLSKPCANTGFRSASAATRDYPRRGSSHRLLVVR